MATQPTVMKIPLWAQALRLIPLLISVLCVILLLVYKPDNYGVLVFAIIGSYLMVAIIMLFAVRKARKRKSK
jgi:ABC-type Fe3+-siderophore transport system permease subunit